VRSFNTKGVDIIYEDWDNLLILDACRYDLFKSFEIPEGKLENRISRGSSTKEFLHGNLSGKKLLDTVYITANPQFYKHSDELETEFHDTWEIWLEEGWNEEYGTVLPETIEEKTIEASEEYPNKRLIVHFLQPHYPFIGEGTDPFSGIDSSMDADGPNCWDRLMRNEISIAVKDIWSAYRNNLERVMPTIERLVNILEGRTIITSDHGNMIGERARPIHNVEWGHPRGIYTKQLVKVPWLIIDGPRRSIIDTAPVQSELTVSEEVVSDRLEELGYV